MYNDLKKEIFSAIESVDLEKILFITNKLLSKIRQGGKLFICGNGGSLTDASHFVGELLGRYNKSDAKSLPAILLSTGGATGSAISNDFGYEFVFSRQIEGLCTKKDFLICLSTSGRSQNIVNALNLAIKMELDSLFLTSIKFSNDKESKHLTTLKIESEYTPAIQHAHMYVLHQICELLENAR